MEDEFRIRKATRGDVAEVVRQRRLLFEDVGFGDLAAIPAMEEAMRRYLEVALENASFHAWLASTPAGAAIGGGAVVIHSHPPSTKEVYPRRAQILNVYTDPAHRRRGVARRLMEAMLAWCREQGYATVSLHATDAGRPLYEALGFRPTNEMRLDLGSASR